MEKKIKQILTSILLEEGCITFELKEYKQFDNIGIAEAIMWKVNEQNTFKVAFGNIFLFFDKEKCYSYAYEITSDFDLITIINKNMEGHVEK